MRRALLLAVVALVVLPAVGDALRHTPPNAQNSRSWLGTWHANFGELYFYDAYRAKSDTPDAQGNPQYYWAVEGTWTKPGQRTRHIHGALDSRDFETMGGCYTPPVEKGSSCGSILIYKSGHRITGGFWNDCRLVCKDHHPWRGSRERAAKLVGFRFTQRGKPDGHSTFRTQTGGAGTLVYRLGPGSGQTGRATNPSHVVSIDEIPGAADHHLRVKLVSGAFVDRGERRETLRIHGYLISSDDPRCHGQPQAAVELTEGHGGVPDKVKLSIQGCRDETWTSANPQRVSVTIDPARATP